MTRRPLQLGPRDRIIPDDVAKLFLDQVKRWDCSCEASLKGLPLCGYDHDGGWPVPGFDELQWLWIHCPECGYDWSIWKLGVSRSFTPALPLKQCSHGLFSHHNCSDQDDGREHDATEDLPGHIEGRRDYLEEPGP